MEQSRDQMRAIAELSAEYQKIREIDNKQKIEEAEKTEADASKAREKLKLLEEDLAQLPEVDFQTDIHLTRGNRSSILPEVWLEKTSDNKINFSFLWFEGEIDEEDDNTKWHKAKHHYSSNEIDPRYLAMVTDDVLDELMNRFKKYIEDRIESKKRKEEMIASHSRFIGQWIGTYSIGIWPLKRSYKFMAELELYSDLKIYGCIIEPKIWPEERKKDKSVTQYRSRIIDFYVWGDNISFTKGRYDGSKYGDPQKYRGKIDNTGRKIFGTWIVEGNGPFKGAKGEFEMIKEE